MKITHVIWSLIYGGAETLLIQLMNLQSANNHVHLVVVNDLIEESLLKKIDTKINIHFIKRPSGSKNPFYFIKLSGILLKMKSDIVHFHQDNLIEYVPIRFFKKNFCLTVHSVIMDKKSLYKYNFLFSISKSVQKQIKQNCSLDSILIYNGINVKEFRIKKEISQSYDKFQIIQIGRLEHLIKGQDLLIEAAALLINKYHYTNFIVRIIGNGNSKDYLQTLIDNLGVSEYVLLEGNKSFENIRNSLCENDLLVQPSRYEGFGLTAIEGMSAKIPVLVANIDGLAEIVQDNEYGYSFEQGSKIDLADKIWKIINEPADKVEALTAKAYQYVNANFDYSITSENYLKSYQKIIAR